MNKFLREFEEFCESPDIASGKARSYMYAIQYLCDFMGIYEIDEESINRIKAIESRVKDKNSQFYNDLKKFLSGRRQSSYLEKGFIRAALKYFFIYINEPK